MEAYRSSDYAKQVLTMQFVALHICVTDHDNGYVQFVRASLHVTACGVYYQD